MPYIKVNDQLLILGLIYRKLESLYSMLTHTHKGEQTKNKWLFFDPSDKLVQRTNHTLKSVGTGK